MGAGRTFGGSRDGTMRITVEAFYFYAREEEAAIFAVKRTTQFPLKRDPRREAGVGEAALQATR